MSRKSKDTRKKRVKNHYLPRALSIALAGSLVSLIRSGFISLLVSAILFMTYFVITFVIVFVWGEWKEKRGLDSLSE